MRIHLFLALFLFANTTLAGPLGGLTYGYVNWPYGNYYNIDQMVRIDTAQPKDSKQGYFWSSTFYAGAMVGYMGLQQLPDGSRLAIFSMWDTVAASAGGGFVARPFGGEGTGMQILGPYAWVEGHMYRLRVWALGNNYWGAWIQDTLTGVETYLGQIQNQKDPGKWLNSTITFTELFAGADSCASLSPVRSTWPKPTANGGSVQANSVTGVTSSVAACGDQVSASATQQSVCAKGAKANLLGDGTCWRYGAQGLSCQSVCAPYGFDTSFWSAGQNVSNAQCSILHRAFGNTNNVSSVQWPSNGMGCMAYAGVTPPLAWNVVSPLWNANASYGFARRLCGCAG